MFAVEEPVYAEDSFHEEKFSPVKQPEGIQEEKFSTVKQPEGIQLTGVYSAEDASAIFSSMTQAEKTLVYVDSYVIGENPSNLDIREALQISNGVIVDNLCYPSDNYAVGNPSTESEKQDDINMFAVEKTVYAEDSFQEEKFSPVKQPEGFSFQEFVTNQLSMLNNNNEVTPKVSKDKSNLSSNQKSVVDSIEVNEANFISLSSCSLLNSTQKHSDSKRLDVSNEKENNELKMKMSVHVKTLLATEKSTDHIPPLNTDKHIKTQSISKVVGCSPEKNSLTIKRKSSMEISGYSNILDSNKNKSNIPEQSIKKDSSIPFPKINLKRKNSEPNSITKIQRVSSPRKSEVQSENHPKHFRNKSSIQLTPKKSNLLGQNIYAIDKVKSPFNCTFRLSPKKPLFGARRNVKSQSLLSKTGLHLPQYFSEKLLPSSSQSKSNSISKVPEFFVNSDSDSDIVVLYTDPKKYSDSDCMIVYETEEQVVLD